jgi:uncharacterized membrane protein
VRFLVLALCAIGLYVSIYMQRKAMLARAGALTEASVVQTPRARVVGGVPNSLIGIGYYFFLATASFALADPAVHIAALIASSLAAAMSLYLAYSLLFVTKMPCVNCWIGHFVNWALFVVLVVGYLRPF